MFDYSRKPVKWQVGNFSYLRSFDLEYSNLYDVICKYRKKTIFASTKTKSLMHI